MFIQKFTYWTGNVYKQQTINSCDIIVLQYYSSDIIPCDILLVIFLPYYFAGDFFPLFRDKARQTPQSARFRASIRSIFCALEIIIINNLDSELTIDELLSYRCYHAYVNDPDIITQQEFKV